jgi:hypothetical protein
MTCNSTATIVSPLASSNPDSHNLLPHTNFLLLPGNANLPIGDRGKAIHENDVPGLITRM